jgi:hypothetical protein
MCVENLCGSREAIMIAAKKDVFVADSYADNRFDVGG